MRLTDGKHFVDVGNGRTLLIVKDGRHLDIHSLGWQIVGVRYEKNKAGLPKRGCLKRRRRRRGENRLTERREAG